MKTEANQHNLVEKEYTRNPDIAERLNPFETKIICFSF